MDHNIIWWQHLGTDISTSHDITRIKGRQVVDVFSERDSSTIMNGSKWMRSTGYRMPLELPRGFAVFRAIVCAAVDVLFSLCSLLLFLFWGGGGGGGNLWRPSACAVLLLCGPVLRISSFCRLLHVPINPCPTARMPLCYYAPLCVNYTFSGV